MQKNGKTPIIFQVLGMSTPNAKPFLHDSLQYHSITQPAVLIQLTHKMMSCIGLTHEISYFLHQLWASSFNLIFYTPE